ncbi:hypothetical protein HRG_013605 [Hirsutella rhossiliensis]
MQNERRVASEGRERNQDVHAAKIVTLQLIHERTVASQAPNPLEYDTNDKAKISSNRIACPKRPSFAVESSTVNERSDLDMVGAFRGLARSGRNRRGQGWLNDYKIN